MTPQQQAYAALLQTRDALYTQAALLTALGMAAYYSWPPRWRPALATFGALAVASVTVAALFWR